MVISGYGIKLVRLRQGDIELVRQMRNAEHVKRYMEYRENITPEMQEKWFQSIDNIHNNYFVIEYQKKKIGLISGAQIDWVKMETGNGGIFIWEQQLWDTPVPLSASILLTDLSFALGFRCTYVRVLKDNPKAIAFNMQLGYVRADDQEEEYNQLYVLTEEAYRRRIARVKEVLHKHYVDKIYCDVTDASHPAEKNFLKIYDQLTEEKKQRLIVTR